jgi:osmoprotectant transport system substrate-binding protein
MRFPRTLALGASLLVLLSACTTGGGSTTIKIGSDNFDEARVVAEIYAQALEANGFTVDRAGIGVGARAVTAAAIESGQIDLKPEYLGGGLAHYGGTPGRSSDENRTMLQAALAPKSITVLEYTPAQDANAFVVRRETAEEYDLAKMSDVEPVQDELRWALATDCPTNPLCAQALKDEYGLEPADVTLLGACSGPMAEALLNETVDVAELCSTSPEITINDWVVLEDDKMTQPAENIVPIVRNELLSRIDRAKFEEVLNDVSSRIDTPTLAQLYYDVSIGRQDIDAVARAWLQSEGLVGS